MDKNALPRGDQPIERRLATILMADVADYSRMMGDNEEQTVHVLRGHRQIFDELLRLHRGRVCNTAGDAILAEFPSAVEAVRAAILFQTRTQELTIGDVEDRRIAFRVGINIGDVIVEPHDIFHDIFGDVWRRR